METYFRFDDEGMEIGKKDSDFKSKFTNTELGFYQGENKVAYINNSNLYVPNNMEVQGTMTVSNPSENHCFDWTVRNNGHLTLMWRRGVN